MKFELRKSKYCHKKPRNFHPNIISFEQYQYENFCEVYITKGEFIKNYEISEEESYKIFSQLIEMYTTPHCFHSGVSPIEFQKIYEQLKSKSRYKGITLGIDVDYDFSINKLGQPIYDLSIALMS